MNLKRQELEYFVLQKEEEEKAGYVNLNLNPQNLENHENLNQDIQFIPVNADYIGGIRDLFDVLGEKSSPTHCGLVCVTRASDYECAWVCGGNPDGTSSECYKKFTQSKILNTLVRFTFQ